MRDALRKKEMKVEQLERQGTGDVMQLQVSASKDLCMLPHAHGSRVSFG